MATHEPWHTGDGELDLALALADEVADELPKVGSDAQFAFYPPAMADSTPQVYSQGDTSSPLQSASASDKERARREKAREKERRRYYRNKGRMSDLQRQVESLECQLWALSSDTDASSSPSVAIAKERSLTEVVSTPQARRQRLQRQLTDAIRATTRLRNENIHLRQQFREESQRMSLLTDLLFSEHQLYLANSSHFKLLKPLSPRACAVIEADCASQVSRFAEEMAVAAPLSGTLSGWREARAVTGEMFKFAITKTFYNISSKAASLQVWAMLLDPVRNVRLYSPALNAEMRFVQKVDEDTFLFVEQMHAMDSDSDRDVVVKAAMLLSRVRTANGHRIYMRGIDQEQFVVEDLLADPATHVLEIWNSSVQFTWVDFEDRESACVVSFAGLTPTIGSNARFWMTEVMLLCLRAENETIGIRFSLPG